MIKDYLENLQDQRRSHPISQADYDSWRQNPITKQLLEDIDMLRFNCADSIIARDTATAGLQAAKYNGVQDTVEFIDDWTPECLEGKDD